MGVQGLQAGWVLLVVVAFVLVLIVLIITFLALRRRRRRNRPIKLPYRQTAESIRNSLAIDVDTSPLTAPETKGSGEPYYLVLDTETLNPIQSSEELGGDFVYSPPIAISWQVLDAKGNLLSEDSYILRLGDATEPIHTNATEIHGITDDMLCRGEVPERVYERLEKVLSTVHVLVAHNLAFHLSVLGQDLRERGLDSLALALVGCAGFCTMEWGRSLGFKVWNGGEALYPRLDELFGYLYFQRMHLPLRYASKTLRDVRLCAACLRCKL